MQGQALADQVGADPDRRVVVALADEGDLALAPGRVDAEPLGGDVARAVQRAVDADARRSARVMRCRTSLVARVEHGLGAHLAARARAR